MLPDNLPEFISTKRFEHTTLEPYLIDYWEIQKIYKLDSSQLDEALLIDTPPPYANGTLHHGHSMSYSQLDIMARFHRMREPTILPLAFDDNGLPTERFTELKYGIHPGEHPPNFFDLCKREAGLAIEQQRHQFDRIGFSYDHQISYRTIDDEAIRQTQSDFIKLYEKGALNFKLEPQLHCTRCRTALAQADITMNLRDSAFYDVSFGAIMDEEIIISTTRPELIPAAMAIFLHPSDPLRDKVERENIQLTNPLTGEDLPILFDDSIDLSIGSGRMMCASFGDTHDIELYRKHQLTASIIISDDGLMNEFSGYQGMTLMESREAVISDLESTKKIRGIQKIEHETPSCERCDTPIEIIMSKQWSIMLLNIKQDLLEYIQKLQITPGHMKKRLIHWIEGLKWDWIISRQRYYGISIPAWICSSCDDIALPEENQLPLHRDTMQPTSCECGGMMQPDGDIFDTWMTSSLTPGILNSIYNRKQNTPLAFRSQAHEIIRTWAFYTLIKHYYQGDGSLPWDNLLISGWGLGFKSKGKRGVKASKSGGSGHNPLALIEKYGADALRYWAASARLGKDQYLSEAILNRGRKIATKLYNATKICLILAEGKESEKELYKGELITTELIEEYESLMYNFDYSQALKLIEDRFWNTFCAIRIEKAKQNRNDGSITTIESKQLLDQMIMYLRLFAPFLPFVTEYLYLAIKKLLPRKGSEYSSLAPTSIHLKFKE